MSNTGESVDALRAGPWSSTGESADASCAGPWSNAGESVQSLTGEWPKDSTTLSIYNVISYEDMYKFDDKV